MMTMFRALIMGTLLTSAAIPAAAEKLSVERVYGEGVPLAGTLARDVQLSPDGDFLTYLRAADDQPKASVLWIMPMNGGPARPLLDTRKLGTAGRVMTEEQLKYLERRYLTSSDALRYRWGDGHDHIVLTFDGDLHLLAVADGSVRRLTETPESELDAKLAPGGRRLSFTRGPNLIIRDVATGLEDRIGEDADETIYYGTAEFVAQEEMRRLTAHWWSPDGARLAYTRVDDSDVRLVTRPRIDSNSVSVTQDRYPLTGTPNSKVSVQIREADGGRTVMADLGSDPDIYVARVAWSRDGRTLYVQRQSRDQKRLDLLAIDPDTGRSRVILSETSDSYVNLEDDFRPLSDGSFLWGSARSGWRHLYHYAADGRLIRQVTSGRWRISNVTVAAPEGFTSLVGVDESAGDVFFLASMDRPTRQDLFRISYRQRGNPVRITSGKGWWTPVMPSRAATGFVSGFSDVETPLQTGLYAIDGRRRAWIAENRLDATHPMAKYLDQRPIYEYGSIKGPGGDDLYFVMAKPRNFDPAKRYPVIIQVYGGPGVQTVRESWRNPSDQLLTQEGYIVFQLDGRGSANRSKAFEQALYGNLGGANSEDQLAGIRHLKSLSYVDGERIGMFGWSFGAYMTVRMLTTPGSGISVGAAGGTPSRFELYDTHYTERFLGTPQANPGAYAVSDLLPRAKDLHGSLLLLHGLSDDNVVIANFTELSAALQREGKLFETVLYPGMAHVPRGGHIWKTYLDFFSRRLGVGPK